MAAPPNGCEHDWPIELPTRSDRERIHTLTPAADELHRRAVRLVADQPDERDVDDLRDLRGDDCEELLRRRLVRDEGRNAPQGGLLIGELAQMALGLFRRRDIAQRSADQERLRLDLAQRQLDGELAAVCPHARQLQSPSEHGPVAGLDEARKGGAVAFA